MAIDAYLQIDGIKGESADSAHPGWIEIASPVLMQHCSMGKTIPKAKLEFMRADGGGKPVKYYQVELENAARCARTR